MKKNNRKQKPTKATFSVLRQICNLIPSHLVPKLTETKVEQDARTYKPWSHVVTLLYAQLTHSLGLNDVCDALGMHTGPLSAIRGATAPKRNTLSNANRQRNPRWLNSCFGRRWRICRDCVRALAGDAVPGLLSVSNA